MVILLGCLVYYLLDEVSEFHSLLHNDSPDRKLHQLHQPNGIHSEHTPSVTGKYKLFFF